ncbi:MAG: NAD(P)H-binding protein [Planctomycetota bacterium]
MSSTTKRAVLVAGATGFTGRVIVEKLLAEMDRFDIRVFVRDPSRLPLAAAGRVTVHVGDFDDIPSLERALEGVDAFINAGSLGFGHGPGIVAALQKMRIPRCVFISTTGIFTKLNPASKAVRCQAESAIEGSGLDWTILRPTMICGGPGDRNMERLLKYLRRFRVMPIVGTGTFLLQPVFVGDVASAAVAVVDHPATVRKAYAVSGREAVAFKELLTLAGKALGRRTYSLRLPMRPIVWMLRMLEKCHIPSPIKSEQILRLNEDKAFPWRDAARDFGYSPADISTVLRKEADLLFR